MKPLNTSPNQINRHGSTNWLWSNSEVRELHGSVPLQSDGYVRPHAYAAPVDRHDVGQALLDAHYADWDFGEDERALIPVPRTRRALKERIAQLRVELLLLESRAPLLFGAEQPVSDFVA